MEDWLKDIDFLFNRHAFSAGQENPSLYCTIGDFGIPLHPPTAHVQAEPCGDFYDNYLGQHPPKGKVVIVSTPYVRGVQTLDIYRPRIKSVEISAVLYKDYLGEHRYGVLNGYFTDQMREEQPDLYKQRRASAAERFAATQRGERHLWIPGGVDKDGVKGESQFELCQRLNQLITDARALYEQGVRTIIVNAHGSSMRAAQMDVLGIESSDHAWKNWPKPNNCQIDLIKGGEHFPAIYPGSPEPDEPELTATRARPGHHMTEAQLG